MRLLLFLLGLSCIISSSYLVLQAPHLHNIYLRSAVGSNVVEVLKTDSMGKPLGGGTGFQIKHLGKKYIITNAHVCDMYQGGSMATLLLPDGSMTKSPILEVSEETDLCAIKGIESLGVIPIGNSVSIGEGIYTVGHPHLMPLNVAPGDILGQQVFQVGLGVIGMDITKEQCSKPKNRIVSVDMGMFGSMDVCIEEVNAYQTTSVTLPGNSGSPVVNWKGEVIGVLFAGDNDVHWGLVITLYDLKDFINNL